MDGGASSLYRGPRSGRASELVSRESRLEATRQMLWIERAVLSGGEEAATTCGIRSPGWMEGGRAEGGKKVKSSQFPPED